MTAQWTCERVIERLRSLGNPNLAKEIGKDHGLAGQLWRTGIHDARGLAALIDDPAKVTPHCKAAGSCFFGKKDRNKAG